MTEKNTNPGGAGKPPMAPLPENWQQMTGDEKFDFYTSNWASIEDKSFASSQVAEKYSRRAQRWLDVIALRKPDRVPDYLLIGEFALANGGCKPADRFYNPQKAAEAVYAFHEAFDYSYLALGMPSSGKALDLLGYNLVRWPGSSLPSGLSEDMQFQYVEDEYMRDDEYDELIANPDSYVMRKYTPRLCQGLEALSKMPSFFNLGELGGVLPVLMPLAAGPLRKAIDTLLQAADQAFADLKPMKQIAGKIVPQFGTPSLFGGVTKAPYDILADTMRGTRGIMMDLFRRPEKIAAACEALVETSIRIAVQAVMFSRNPFVFMFLHKGADGFMSNEQFEKFYWPSFKKQLLGMIDQGIVPILFAEGGFNQRLDIIAQSGLPEGKTVWLFDRTDMAAAKEKFGSFACIGGNVPGSLFMTGTTEGMEAYCKELIETVGADGGFFLSPGASLDQVRPENVHAFLNSAKKYGRY